MPVRSSGDPAPRHRLSRSPYLSVIIRTHPYQFAFCVSASCRCLQAALHASRALHAAVRPASLRTVHRLPRSSYSLYPPHQSAAPPLISPHPISSRGCPTCPDIVRLSDHEKVSLKMWILMKKVTLKMWIPMKKVTLKM